MASFTRHELDESIFPLSSGNKIQLSVFVSEQMPSPLNGYSGIGNPILGAGRDGEREREWARERSR